MPPSAVRPGRDAQRALRSDVNGIGAERVERTSDIGARAECKSDIRVGRAGHGREHFRRNSLDHNSHGRELAASVLESVDDAVGLRPPGVRDQHQSHALQADQFTFQKCELFTAVT